VTRPPAVEAEIAAALSPGSAELHQQHQERLIGETEPYLLAAAAFIADQDVTPSYDDGSEYTAAAMARAFIYRATVGQWTSFDAFERHLNASPKIAWYLGFGDGVPDADTLRHWWGGFDEHTRDTIRTAARDYYAEKISDRFREMPAARGLPMQWQSADDDTNDGPDVEAIEQDAKDDAYEFHADLIRDVVSYDRDLSTEYDDGLITDMGSHMARLGDTVESARDRLRDEHDLADQDVLVPETFRRTVRNVERHKTNELGDGTDWTLPHEFADPELDGGTEREAKEEAWKIDPRDPDEQWTWHHNTEEIIERQLDRLRSKGIIDDDDEFDLSLDYTVHPYYKHGSTDSEHPIGVHKQTHLETGYGWKELQATVVINGRAFVVASINYTPETDTFQAYKYVIDRAQELLNIRRVYADAEFCTVKFVKYLNHRGLEYVIRKALTQSVQTKYDGFSGGAEWENGWEMISDGRFDHVEMNLVAVEKDIRSRESSAGSEDESDPQAQLTDFGSGEASRTGVDDGQMTFADLDSEDEDVDYVTFATNIHIEKEGINPAANPVGHDDENTAWGIAEKYRDRWSIETAFRDRKGAFQPETTSRDLGFRRYLWMFATALYNAWVCLNIAVAAESPVRRPDEIVVRKASFKDEMDRRLLSEFPGVAYG